MKRGGKIAFLFTLVLMIPLLPGFARAQTTTAYVQEINYKLEQPFGGETVIKSWGGYIRTVYQFAVGLVAVIAVVLIMIGGVRWIIAAGNESAIGEAREMISSAVIGLVIALLSYSLLVFINPKLIEQNFSVAIVPVPNSDLNFWKRDWCHKSSPDVASQQCNSANSGTLQCSVVPCGDLAVYELNGSASTCRGVYCATGDGSPGCYPKPSNPNSEATCQMEDCGTWAQKCFGGYLEPGDIDEYNTCLCEYYQEKAMPLVGAGTDPYSYASDTTGKTLYQFALFCGENYPQDTLVSDIMTNPNGVYTYSGTEATLKQKGLNCNFGCEIDNAPSTTWDTVNLSSFDSIASWLTEETATNAFECKKS